ncbi:MAG TPA: hypothetical protein PK349_11605 [Candidatus Hydrogenedentes bacterium]|nr:hypothetical protein [Candidatus Hydrogenedentota bacterium]
MIPCFITSWNLLTPLIHLVEDVRRLGLKPVIVDNASTYPPLLAWLDQQKQVEVVRARQNHGPRVAWALGLVHAEKRCVVTDGDLDLSSVPDDAIEILNEGFSLDKTAHKVGLSLAIGDLPAEAPLTSEIRQWEHAYWKKPTGQAKGVTFYEAPIDTTFALYDNRRPGSIYGPALRVGPPYMARHLPWYWTRDSINDELRFYLKTTLTERPSGISWSFRLAQVLLEENP